ncbi:MAG: formylglycine-generating enzyme family protein, partial [Pseudomonadota bacterium]
GKNLDCCASLPVIGGVDQCLSSSGAVLQDFVLDKFEVTIGRFKQFIAAPSATRLPTPGSGTHPSDANCRDADAGWDPAWDDYLPSSNLVQDWAGQCGSSTWTQAAGAQPGDWLPASCITWFEAQAFCIWDGGYLPSWSELSYAAKGGSNDWKYPWGTAPIDSAHAVYDPWSGDSARPVGSLPAGDGRWQHSDLAGNVWEWCSYNAFNGDGDCSAAPCHCNSTTAQFAHGRAFGGSYGAQPEELTSTFFATGEGSTAGGFITLKPEQNWADLSDVGFRCARAPTTLSTH